jgi:hypothetical protein
MKPDTIKTGARPATASDLDQLADNHDVNFPNDFGKIGA